MDERLYMLYYPNGIQYSIKVIVQDNLVLDNNISMIIIPVMMNLIIKMITKQLVELFDMLNFTNNDVE